MLSLPSNRSVFPTLSQKKISKLSHSEHTLLRGAAACFGVPHEHFMIITVLCGLHWICLQFTPRRPKKKTYKGPAPFIHSSNAPGSGTTARNSISLGCIPSSSQLPPSFPLLYHNCVQLLGVQLRWKRWRSAKRKRQKSQLFAGAGVNTHQRFFFRGSLCRWARRKRRANQGRWRGHPGRSAGAHFAWSRRDCGGSTCEVAGTHACATAGWKGVPLQKARG